MKDKCLIVWTQDDLDKAARTDYAGQIIVMGGTASRPLFMRKKFWRRPIIQSHAVVIVCGKAWAIVLGNGTVYARDNANVIAKDNAFVSASGEARLEMHGCSRAKASGDVRISAFGQSRVVAIDNVRVRGQSYSRIWAVGNGKMQTGKGVRVGVKKHSECWAYKKAQAWSADTKGKVHKRNGEKH